MLLQYRQYLISRDFLLSANSLSTTEFTFIVKTGSNTVISLSIFLYNSKASLTDTGILILC